jgi:hypothetical protein
MNGGQTTYQQSNIKRESRSTFLNLCLCFVRVSLSCLFDARFVGHRVPMYAAGYHFLCLFVFKTNKQKRDKPISIYVEQHSSCRVVASENCRRGNAGRGGREFPPPSSLRNNWKSRVHVWSCSSYLYLHILPVESWLWPLCGWCINGHHHRHHHHPLNLTARHSSIDIAVSLPAATQLNPRTVRAPPSYISTHMLCVHHKSSTCVEEKISPQTILLLNI